MIHVLCTAHSCVAQLAEHPTVNRTVTGSSPVAGAKAETLTRVGFSRSCGNGCGSVRNGHSLRFSDKLEKPAQKTHEKGPRHAVTANSHVSGKVHETLRERHPNVSQGITAGIMRNHPNPTRPCRSLQNRERTRCMSRPEPRRPPHGIGNHVAAFIDITAISNLRKTQSSRYNPNNLLYLDCVIMLTEHEDIRPSWSKTRS